MSIYSDILNAHNAQKKLLAILIDPDKFELNYAFAKAYLKKLPYNTTHLFIGGSTDSNQKTDHVVKMLKDQTDLPVVLFPGSYSQVTPAADALLFLSLLSGDNPEFLIGQQIKAARIVQKSNLEVIPTAYILIDGGTISAVQRVSKTLPMPQYHEEQIVATSLAGEYLGKKLLYLEAGSGAKTAVKESIITAVSDAVSIPIIVGGGIKSQSQICKAYEAGATLVVVGTAFEDNSWESSENESS
ncbi:geranylgeranylglyceryl/heptaprenylglyceryl phosphate synthase [Dokdonia sp. Hel_I_53]|uniref:geranylgeranylglyceryl/heptaprenylglyceryl phosphate synthase n=1 Tax=Dokdonia sp. Hel_I_53 TaxID=1566287 RepID=UPI0011990894|nr:geranylgeranylglyceryl/heptaprenylglyceryl phosphate synthase [Dokdonia sp. Hel_I_53]TVZ52831.1 putative glycerol-1-phosphate prenyltransferase [Dokdonia sp. Hel_I_53]